MDNQQLIFRDDDLYSQTTPHSWGRQIQLASQCIILMARCKLLVSRSPLTSLDLSGHGLKYDSLRANVGHCTQMGQETFRSTAEHMGRVGVLTKAMSEAGGTIQRIIRCVETTSRFRDKQLPSLITEGLQAVDESVDIISQVKENFSEWKHLTQNVLRALEEHTSSNEMQHRNAQRKLVQTQGRAEELQQLTQKIEESREAFNEALQDYKDTYSNLRTSNSDVDPWITALVALYRSPKVIPTAIAMGDPWKMDRRLAAAQQTISFLTNRLGELEDEIQATGDVVAILNSTLGDLTKLQQQIENFLDFLLSIQKVVKVIEDSRDRVLIRNLTSEDLHELKRDPESKRDFIRDAHRIQMRFMIACKAATLYNEVSDMFIIPGVAWVGGLCFIDCSEDAYEKSLLEIQARDRQLCEGASQLIEKRVDEIGNELKTLCNMSANSPAQHVTKSVERVAVMENETLDDDMEK